MTYRVVQWATGAMGLAVLRALIDHSGIELAGVLVYGSDKHGRDAGEIARRAETGVLATRDVDQVLALDADVVVHAARLGPYGSHDEDLIRILESGKNVVTINGYSKPTYWMGGRRDALDAACQAGGSSLMSAGLNPGFVGEQLAVVVSGLCSELATLDIVENADGRLIAQPDYLFGVLGFGADPGGQDPNDVTWGPVSALNGMYEEAVAAIAHRLGMTLDRVQTDHRVFVAAEDLQVAAGVVRKGTVSHTNWRWYGIVNGTRTISMSINWYVETTNLDNPDPPLWEVLVVGQPGVRVSVNLEKHPADRSRMGAEQYALAGAVINSIPAVCAAPPGLITRPIVTPYRADYAVTSAQTDLGSERSQCTT